MWATGGLYGGLPPSTNAPPLGTGRVFYFFHSRVVFIVRETTVCLFAVNGVSTALSPARPPVRARRAFRTSNRRVPLPGGRARVLRFRVPVTPSTVPAAAAAAGNSLFRSPRALLARFSGYARVCAAVSTTESEKNPTCCPRLFLLPPVFPRPVLFLWSRPCSRLGLFIYNERCRHSFSPVHLRKRTKSFDSYPRRELSDFSSRKPPVHFGRPAIVPRPGFIRSCSPLRSATIDRCAPSVEGLSVHPTLLPFFFFFLLSIMRITTLV